MESTFLSKENLDNIYEYLNTKVVKQYNLNLNTNEKNKKLVKKLSKTIFRSLNSKIQNMNINEFNELVVNKSMPFVKQHLDKEICKNNLQNSNNINNLDLTKSVKLGGEKTKQKKTKLNKKKSNEYDNYLKDTFEFENLVKQSNNKIKNNFKNLIKKNQNNFVKECEKQDVNDFILNRCSAKDMMQEKNLSKSAFEEIVEKKTFIDLNNGNQINQIGNENNQTGSENNQIDNENNQINKLNNKHNQNYPTTSSSLNNIDFANDNSQPTNGNVDYYDNNDINYRKLFSEILVNQKDFSKNNKIESYEGETYLPNLIPNVGEEAPIQPLLYQNTKKGSELINNYSIIIDTGNVAGGGYAGATETPATQYDLTTDDYNNVVSLISIYPWQRFRVNLEDTFQIDKITDIYLKSFSLIGATSVDKCLFFVLDIQEFNLRSFSNNPHLKSKIVIQNTIQPQTFVKEDDIAANAIPTTSITTVGPTVDTVFTKTYARHSNYLTTITPSNYRSLNINLTNENNEGADDGNDKTFVNRASRKNRVIFELDFVTRKLKDPVFDYTVSKETLEASTV